MAIRTFLAIPLSLELQRQVAAVQHELHGLVPGVRWTPVANVHLTLRFFGATSADDLEKIREVVLSIAFREVAFTAIVGRLGVFPHPRAPRVLWLGVTAPRLRELYTHCETALQQIGFPGEGRGFTPHLTIGRLHQCPPRLSEVLAAWENRQFAPLPVDQLIFYESQLLPGGARHLPLLTAPLGSGSAGL